MLIGKLELTNGNTRSKFICKWYTIGKENSKDGFRSGVERGTRYLAAGALTLAAVVSLGAGNLIIAAAEAFTGYLYGQNPPSLHKSKMLTNIKKI